MLSSLKAEVTNVEYCYFVDFLVSAAVAEFKGPVIFGVVRLAQVSMELARIEASFSGLSPGKHGWAINEFGDLTRGAESTGKMYNPANISSEKVKFNLLGMFSQIRVLSLLHIVVGLGYIVLCSMVVIFLFC